MAFDTSRWTRWLLALSGLAAPAAGQIPDRFTNLKVLPADISRADLVATMRGWTSALGVRCGHCHLGGDPETLIGVDFASDQKWEKRTARAMLLMVRALEAEHLAKLEHRPESAGPGSPPAVSVSCLTCHHGLRRPDTLDAALDRVLAADGPEAAVRTYRELRARHLGQGSYDFSERPVNDLAERLLKTKRSRDAVLLLEVSLEFNPEAAWQHHLLGEARLAAGDRRGALQAFTRALALSPQNGLSRRRVEELKSAGDRPARVP
jgi:hypothetical protein